MKFKLVLAISLALSIANANAQTKKLNSVADQYAYDSTKDCDQFESLDKNKKPSGQINPLSSGAFDRFVTDLYSFTILGSQSPVTGIKVETSKPSISVKGNILSNQNRTFITSLELSAGLDGDFMQLFSANKLSTLFKATVGFNQLLGHNTANFNDANYFLLCDYRKKSAEKYQELVSLSDTLKIIKALIDQNNIKAGTLTWQSIQTHYQGTSATAPDAAKVAALQLIAAKLIKDYSNLAATEAAIVANIDNLLAIYAATWKTPASESKGKAAMLVKYNKLLKLDDKFVDSLYNFELQQVAPVWTRKRVYWLNVSPNVSNAAVSVYDASLGAMSKGNSFLYGVKASLNWLVKQKEAHQFWYVYGGVALQKVNNIEEMTQYSYKKSTSIKTTDPTINKEEDGVAYEGTLKEGFGADVFAGAYAQPWAQSFLPGLYGEVKLSYGDAWVNKEKLSAAMGIIWNVTNGDKDAKNLLSIVPFVKWSNLFKQYKDETHVDISPLHDQFMVGVQVGIPINIGTK